MDQAFYRPEVPASPLTKQPPDPIATLDASLEVIEASGDEKQLAQAERQAVLFLRRRMKRLRDMFTPADGPGLGPLGLMQARVDIGPTAPCPVCLTQV